MAENTSLQCVLDSPHWIAAEYPSLDAAVQFRLFRLLPGSVNDPIRIDVFTSTLEEPPDYEALSYSWGNEVSKHKIHMNGADMLVTVNLEAALRHLRRPDLARIMWVDAICINQKVTTEKNQQVQLMGKIYSNAGRVVVWLGAGDQYSDSVLDFILSNEAGNFDFELHFRLHILSFCRRDWFSRVWVVQEIALAQQDPLVMCGSRSLPWTTLVNFLSEFLKIVEAEFNEPQFPHEKFKQGFVDLAFRGTTVNFQRRKEISPSSRQTLGLPSLESSHFEKEGEEEKLKRWAAENLVVYSNGGQRSVWMAHFQLARHLPQIVDMHNIRMAHNPDFFEKQIRRVRSLNATDQRDKVYAVLAISRFHGVPVTPDYALPLGQVYAEAGKNLIVHAFEYGYPDFTLGHMRPYNEGWRSWVPDLRGLGKLNTGYDAASLCPPHDTLRSLIDCLPSRKPMVSFSKDDDNTMTTVGVTLGTIIFTTPLESVTDLRSMKKGTMSDSLGKICLELNELNIAPQAAFDAIMAYSKSYRHVSDTTRAEMVVAFERFWKHRTNPETEPSNSEDIDGICDVVSDAHQFGRLIFVTDTGKVGLSPKLGLPKGMLLAGLFGFNFPILLRRHENSHRYHMENVAYVANHQWGHEFVQTTSDFEGLTRDRNMEIFEIY